MSLMEVRKEACSAKDGDDLHRRSFHAIHDAIRRLNYFPNFRIIALGNGASRFGEQSKPLHGMNNPSNNQIRDTRGVLRDIRSNGFDITKRLRRPDD